GARAYVNRMSPELAGLFTSVPVEAGERAAWRAAGAPLIDAVRERNEGASIDVVVSSVGRDLFGRMIELLAPGGRLVFYGATTGYTLAFVGKPGAAGAREMLNRVDVRPNEGVLIYYGVDGRLEDAVGADAIGVALAARARVVVATRLDSQA